MTFTYEDITLYYERYGYDKNKKSIVILPGWGDNRKTFSYIINFLKYFYTIYIIDLPGFGKSNFPNKDLTIYDYTLLIQEFIRFLKLEQPILIGHSFGGRIILTLCGYYRFEAKKIVLIDSAGIRRKRNILLQLKTYLYKFLKKLKFLIPKRKRKNYLQYLLHIFASKDYKNLNNSMRKTFQNIVNEDLSYYLKEITCTTLLLLGKKDKDTPLKDAKKMNKNIKNSTLLELNGSHFCYLENIRLVNKILYEYLTEDKKKKDF